MEGAGITNLMLRVIATQTEHRSLVEASLPGIPASVPAARRFVSRALPECPRAADLMLAASEFATNAVAWSASGCGGSFVIRVRQAGRWARVEVSDAGPAPVPAASSHGWGLALVAATCDRTGANIGDDGSRTAWAEVTWP